MGFAINKHHEKHQEKYITKGVEKMNLLNYKVENRIATVSINRPPANALATELLKELNEVVDKIENDADVKVVILHGEGRFFSAGADIKEFTQVQTIDQGSSMSSYGQRVFERIEGLKKPVIAAIHGAALGGGLELAMSCHIRLVAKKTKLGLPELTLGLIPGFGGTQRLARYVGYQKAAEMMLTSEPITGEEAVQCGLALRCYEDEEQLLEGAKELAEKIANKSAIAIGYALESLSYVKDVKFQEGIAKEADLFGRIFMSEDTKEGINAFIEKRKPNFQDR